MELLKRERSEIKDILRRIVKRDFSGNTGLAIKNTAYQISTNLVAEFSGLAITIFLARILLPDLFGLYNLALSTILIFTSLSDLGIGSALVKFISSKAESPEKAKSFFNYLFKIKIVVLALLAICLIASANYLSNEFYKKPIFLALIAGALYILLYGTLSFFQSVLQSLNKFKSVFVSESIFEASRIILLPIIVLLSLKFIQSDGIKISLIVLVFSLAYLFSFIFVIFSVRKNLKTKANNRQKLSKEQTFQINKFLLATSAMAFSGLFFSYIDRILLGHFVGAQYIGYYMASFGLIGAITSVTAFSSALLPIFSRLDREKIKKGLGKSIRTILLFSSVAVLGVIIFSPLIITIIYGTDYSQSINLLRILSPMIFLISLIGVYSTYFTSRGKPWVNSYLLIGSTILNIALNYLFITSLLKYGDIQAVYGSAIATIISQSAYLLGLFLFSKKDKSHTEDKESL